MPESARDEAVRSLEHNATFSGQERQVAVAIGVASKRVGWALVAIADAGQSIARAIEEVARYSGASNSPGGRVPYPGANAEAHPDNRPTP